MNYFIWCIVSRFLSPACYDFQKFLSKEIVFIQPDQKFVTSFLGLLRSRFPPFTNVISVACWDSVK